MAIEFGVITKDAQGNQITSKVPAKEASIAMRIIRADVTIEERGIVSYWHKNPLKRWMFEIKRVWRERQQV